MIGLIRKDLFLTRKAILTWCAMLFFYSGSTLLVMHVVATNYPESLSSLPSFSVMNFCMALMTISSLQDFLICTDLGKKTRYYYCATPLGIKGFVASKYYETFLAVLAAFVFCLLYDLLYSLITGHSEDHVLLYFAVMMASYLIPCILIPLYVGFGSHGAQIKTAILLFLVCIVGCYLLFGDISFFMKDNPVEAINRLIDNADTEKILEFLLGKAYGKLVLALLCVHLFLPLVYLSYRISCALFRKGALSYEA